MLPVEFLLTIKIKPIELSINPFYKYTVDGLKMKVGTSILFQQHTCTIYKVAHMNCGDFININ